MNGKKILYDSPDAASIKTVTGWVSSKGHFYGGNEHMARYDGCTHRPCQKCGNEIEVRSYCKPCARKRIQENYDAMPEADWDGVGMLHLHDSDVWFRHAEDVVNYCADNGVKPADLHLVIGDPYYAKRIDPNKHYANDLEENDTVPAEIADAFRSLNEAIDACRTPLCWWNGNTRVSDACKARMIETGDTP